MLSVYLMYRRFARALKIAAQDEGFVQIFGAGTLLVIVGTLTYTTSQGWSLINGFYFAIATLTTSSIADPSLTIESGWIKAFTVIYILIGIGILVELARQVGFAFVEVHRQDQATRQAKRDAKHHPGPA
jgi:Ion channel